VQDPGKWFIERPSCCRDGGYLYFMEIGAGWISRKSMDGKYEPFHNIGAPGDREHRPARYNHVAGATVSLDPPPCCFIASLELPSEKEEAEL
jgi:hypothetical protein